MQSAILLFGGQVISAGFHVDRLWLRQVRNLHARWGSDGHVIVLCVGEVEVNRMHSELALEDVLLASTEERCRK